MVVFAPWAEAVQRRDRMANKVAITQAAAHLGHHDMTERPSGFLEDCKEAIAPFIARPWGRLVQQLNANTTCVSVLGGPNLSRSSEGENGLLSTIVSCFVKGAHFQF